MMAEERLVATANHPSALFRLRFCLLMAMMSVPHSDAEASARSCAAQPTLTFICKNLIIAGPSGTPEQLAFERLFQGVSRWCLNHAWIL